MLCMKQTIYKMVSDDQETTNFIDNLKSRYIDPTIMIDPTQGMTVIIIPEYLIDVSQAVEECSTLRAI